MECDSVHCAVRRLPVVFPSVGAVIVVFLLVRIAPGDPAVRTAGESGPRETVEAMRTRFGLDRPWHTQLGLHVGRVVQVDLSRPSRTQPLIIDDHRQFVPITVEFALGGLGIAMLIGIRAGVIPALRLNAWADLLVTMASLIGAFVPLFWFGLLAMLCQSGHPV